MNFTGIVQEILSSTKRPDKILTARREVNAAILNFTSDYDFERCVAELLLPISSVDYTQVLSFSDLPRFRKFQYIRRSGTQCFLDKLSNDKILTPHCNTNDKYYIAGAGVSISLADKAASLDIGYYQYPPMLDDSAPDYWMLDGGWSAVFNKALAKVFADIGDDASAQKHERLAINEFEIFRNGNARSKMQ